MTLILTRIARDGIVMAADSAVTEEFDGRVRVLHGAKKLFPHPESRSCIATWGGGVVPNPSGGDPIPVEFLIERFVHQERFMKYGEQLADTLREWLGSTYIADRAFIGIDVAS